MVTSKPVKKAQVTGADVVAAARSFLGIPYVFGGTDPRSGLDCSGLILVVCHKLGISCPRTSEEQFGAFQPVSSPSVGDLVFFVGDPIDPPPGHVGIVTSPGTMINAPFTGTVVRYDHFSPGGQGVNRVMGYRRLHGVARSTSANSSLASNAGQSPSRVAASAAGAFGGIALFVVGAIVVAVAVAMLVLGGMMFAGGS